MWFPFRMNGRGMEWPVEHGTPRRLFVRSRSGGFLVQCLILDDVFAKVKGTADRLGQLSSGLCVADLAPLV
jgi:hypothetical protein